MKAEHRSLIEQVQRAALEAVDPAVAIHRHLRREGDRLIVGGGGDVPARTYDLATVERVFVVGGGKAATPMVAALAEVLGDRLTRAVAVTKYGHVGPGDLPDGRVRLLEASHPVPDEAGVRGAQEIARLLADTTEQDLVLCAISGGGSALLVSPAPGLTLADLQAVTDLLLRSGATIVELNAVRKHCSRIKGGGLARMAAPAPIVSLILSDVVGDPLDVIASGPTAPDPTTFADAWAVLERYGLVDRAPPAVVARLRAGMAGEVPETPKPGDPLFERVQNVIVASNRLAAEAAVETARELGFHALLLSTYVEGEAREVARVAAALAKEVVRYGRPVARPACLVWGGETTVTVRGKGKGGRNQELALAAALALEGWPDVVFVALATDGTDGPTDAAGAIATGETVRRARALGLDPLAHLADNDAYPFFQALGDLILTGPTQTNVNDLLFIFVFG